jgi:hypothetical protein
MHWLILGIIGYFAYPLVLKPSAVKLVTRLPPAREAVFRHAMKQTDPAQLTKMADAFSAEGFAKESDQLRARASLRAHPKETLQKYAEIIKRALSSTNIQAVEDVAQAFREDGAASIADLLDEYAAGMTTLKDVPPVIAPASAFAAPQLPPSPPGAPPGAAPAPGATMNGESVYVPPGVDAATLAMLGVHGVPPAPQQYNPLGGQNPFVAQPGNMPDNRPLGVPPPNNNFQADGTPGIGLPGVMPVRPGL